MLAAAAVDSSSGRRVKISHRNPLIDRRSNNFTTCFRFFQRSHHEQSISRIVTVRGSVLPRYPPPPPSSSGANSLPWKMWVVTIVLSIMLPSFRVKLWRSATEQLDTAVETAEMMTDIVEDAAEQVEKFIDGIGNRLPEGELKDALERLEEAADKLEHSAEQAGDYIDKVHKVGEDVESYIRASALVRKVSDVDSSRSNDAPRP